MSEAADKTRVEEARKPRSLLALRRDRRGAVLAEFVIAIVPILVTFFSFVQLSRLATARLVMKHGAIVGARAASVITNGKDNTPDQKQGENKGDVEMGVKMALGPWARKGVLTNVQVEIQDQSNRTDYYGWVTVTVTADYQCKVPMGQVVCGGGSKKLTESYRMPHQGAIYKK